MLAFPLPKFTDVVAAAERIAPFCIETPLFESPVLNEVLGGRLLLKAECLQTTGSFKLRGAASRLTMMNDNEKRQGVVARSSGNHGLAVAHCARMLGMTAVVVAPFSAPAAKIDRIRACGARVVQTSMNDLPKAAAEIEVQEGRVFVPPADDFWIVAGAGTVGLEIAREANKRELTIDAVLTCSSGGGLTGGCILGLSQMADPPPVIAVEAEGFEKMAQSMRAGHCVDLIPGGHSICDAINGLYMARLPFEITKDHLGRTIAVNDDEALEAMRIGFAEFGLALEPGGAVALAAVLTRKYDLRGRTAVVVLSGRNVDLQLAAQALLTSHFPQHP